ncbi:MAG: hypothetical protein K8H90_07585 [Thermoanaerobaculia bacterium]|nr:hypothetical protein [Thermoanaerobaculia bacterium]
MKVFEDRTFVARHDKDSSAVFEHAAFRRCIFVNCTLSDTKDVTRRSTVRDVALTDCRIEGSAVVGPAVLDEVVIDGLSYHDLVLAFGPLLRHVTLRNRVGAIKINAEPHMVDRSPAMLAAFAAARAEFYAATDWALDISEAEFTAFEIDGVPAQLIRRDRDTQAVVRRATLAGTERHNTIPAWNEHWSNVIELALEDDSEYDIVLVAPKAAPKRTFRKLVDGIQNLRDLGIAEPD